MLITKFNKLIRNKIVWSVFAGIVAFFFVGASITSRGCSSSDQRNQGSEGRLFGNDVPYRDFSVARYFEIGLRRDRPLSPDENAVLRERTWARLASLQLADRLQIAASETEIQSVLEKDPGFSRNGVFDKDLYTSIIANQLRITPQTYEEYLQQELTLKKLYDTVSSMVWITPSEIETRLRDLTDTMTAEYVVVSNKETVASADVTEEQAKQFFENNPSLFTIPDRIRVKYVSFAISNYMAQAAVTEEDVVEFYNENIGDYTTESTNEIEVVVPLEDVREGILASLMHRESTFEAVNAATDFATQLGTDRYGSAVTFEDAVSRSGLTVHTTEYFSASQSVEGIDAGMDFTRAAFALDANDRDNYFSDAIAGDSYVYIAVALDSDKSHDPLFEDVRDDVLPLAARELQQTRFTEYLDAVRTSFQEQTSPTQTFALVAASMGFNVSTSAPLSVYESYAAEDPYTRMLPVALADVAVGELSDPLPLGDSAIIAHLTSRTAGDLLSAQMLRPQLIQMLKRYRATILVSEWSKNLLKIAELEDLRPVITDDEDDDEMPEEDV